jgi:hypothetical protein
LQSATGGCGDLVLRPVIDRASDREVVVIHDRPRAGGASRPLTLRLIRGWLDEAT